MNEVDHIRDEVQPPETYLGPRIYKVFCLCQRCGNEFSYKTAKLTAKDKPCPRKACREAIRQEEILEAAQKIAGVLERGPPAFIGNNNYVKAVDTTADMVMQDYKLTDLKDNIKPGEIAAPKLSASMQKAADGFFGGNVVGDNYASKRLKARMSRIGAAALAGAYKDSAINPSQIVGGTANGPAFRSLGKTS